MTTPLVLYGSSVAATTLTTACKLSVTTGGTSTSKTTTCTDVSASHYWYMEVLSLGGTNGDVSALPAPTAKGYLYDVTTLEGQIISSGNWSAVVRIDDSVGFASVDLIIRAYVYNAGVYTYINKLQALGVALTSTTTNYTMPNVSFAATTFGTGDKLYLDFWVFANGSGGHWNGDPIRTFTSSNGAAGIANQFVITTPGFVPSLVTNTTNFTESTTVNEVETVLTAFSTTETGTVVPLLALQSNAISMETTTSIEATITVSSVNVLMILTPISETTNTTEAFFVQSFLAQSDLTSWSDVVSLFGAFTTSETIIASETTLNTVWSLASDITKPLETIFIQAFQILSSITQIIETDTLLGIESFVETSVTNDTFIKTQYSLYIESILSSEITVFQPIQVFFSSTQILESYAILGIDTLLETTTSSDISTGASSSPVPVDPASQMLYATLQLQYTRLRLSTTNAHIQIMAIVYYIASTAQSTSEYGVPGEIDILLIGETLSQLHVLKTVNDVTAFIAANP